MSEFKLLPDAAGRPRPTWAPKCCLTGIHVIHPETGLWVCSECQLHGPVRPKHGPFDLVLDREKMELAFDVARERHEINVRAGRKDTNNFRGDPLEIHRMGAKGELAAALILRRPWNDPVRKKPVKAPDVGECYVKTTSARGRQCLVIRKTDLACPPGPYVLAVVDNALVSLRGWIPSQDIPTVGKWKLHNPDRPAYWVLSRDLKPMFDLPPYQPPGEEDDDP